MVCQDRRGVDQPEIGRQLRARRTAAGRTVASVAADAGPSVPYIANLENGRGNPPPAAPGGCGGGGVRALGGGVKRQGWRVPRGGPVPTVVLKKGRPRAP